MACAQATGFRSPIKADRFRCETQSIMKRIRPTLVEPTSPQMGKPTNFETKSNMLCVRMDQHALASMYGMSKTLFLNVTHIIIDLPWPVLERAENLLSTFDINLPMVSEHPFTWIELLNSIQQTFHVEIGLTVRDGSPKEELHDILLRMPMISFLEFDLAVYEDWRSTVAVCPRKFGIWLRLSVLDDRNFELFKEAEVLELFLDFVSTSQVYDFCKMYTEWSRMNIEIPRRCLIEFKTYSKQIPCGTVIPYHELRRNTAIRYWMELVRNETYVDRTGFQIKIQKQDNGHFLHILTEGDPNFQMIVGACIDNLDFDLPPNHHRSVFQLLINYIRIDPLKKKIRAMYANRGYLVADIDSDARKVLF